MASTLPPYPTPLTTTAIESSTTSFTPAYIIAHLLTLSDHLLTISLHSNIFGSFKHDPNIPSLRTLYDRLHAGHAAPSLLPAYLMTEDRISATLSERCSIPVSQRPLSDFQDLYCAVLARMQEMLHFLRLRLENNWITLTTPIYTNGPTVAALYDDLSQYWVMLNDPACGKALDAAIRHATIRSWHRELVQQTEMNVCTEKEAREMLDQLYDEKGYKALMGLEVMQDWAPAMVGAWLDTKYRVLLGLEKQKARAEKRKVRPKVMKGHLVEKDAVKRYGGVMEVDAHGVDTNMWSNVDHETQPQQQQSPLGYDIKAPAVEDIHPALRANFDINHQAHQGHHVQQERFYAQPLAATLDTTTAPNAVEDPQALTDANDALSEAIDWQLRMVRLSGYAEHLRRHAGRNARYLSQGN